MLYVWEILKQFFQVVLLLYSGQRLSLLEQCGMALQRHRLNYLVQLVTNGTLDSSNKKLINEFKLAAEGKSLPEAWAQIPEKLFMTILEITQLKVDYSEQVL
jgi:hypothetical protein